jgi:hypothetical protein
MPPDALDHDGIFPSHPFADYVQRPEISRSPLNVLCQTTPFHLKHYLDQGRPDTPALISGSAAHVAVLERARFDELYVQGPEGDRRTKATKAAWEEAEAEHGKGFVLRPDGNSQELGYADVLAMSDAVLEDPVAGPLVAEATHTEATVLCHDPVSGVRVKARFDLAGPVGPGGAPAVVDYKTTASGVTSLHTLARVIAKYGYHRQGGFYLHVANNVGLPVQDFGIIWQEKRPPWAVRVTWLRLHDLLAGRDQILRALDQYQTCLKTDRWPGFTEASVVDLPEYLTSDDE